MENQWIEAGFFIISDGRSPEREPRLLPSRLVTVSACIAEVYPDIQALTGVGTPVRLLRSMRESLRLDQRDFAFLRSWVEIAMEREDLGWPNVFYSLRTAREFKRRFLRAAGDTRLVGLSLEQEVANEFMQEEEPAAGCGGYGVWTMLMRKVPLTHNAAPLGYDLLGTENDGSFHTFSCNGLDQELNKNLGISFNDFGLIDDYRMAVAACEYVNRDDVGTEPVRWHPFRVDEYQDVEEV